MIAFADLLERLVFTPGRLAKIALLRRYFETAPDPTAATASPPSPTNSSSSPPSPA